jgi:leader peptidase (prepilin peptidase)/N-methyltransferase
MVVRLLYNFSNFMSSLTLLYWFVTGTVFGSFLNVCIYRLPRGESLLFPASRCPHCGRRLNVLDLIPLVGYLLLLGRCRGCRAPISPRYPLVELLTGLIFLQAAGQAGGNWPWLIFACFLACCLIIVFFIDLELQVIPDSVNIAGGAAGLAFNLARGINDFFLPAVAGMIAGYLLMFGIGQLGRFLFRQEALGEGDMFLAAMLGACLGWSGMLLAVLIGYLAAALLLLVLLALGRVKMGQAVPFGPALALGGLVTLFWGEQIIHWYLFSLI